MSSVNVSSDNAAGSPPVLPGEMRLEVVVVPVSDVDRSRQFYESLGWRLDAHAGTAGRVSGPADGHADYCTFVAFSDPDGNGWLHQEIKTRLPGR